MPGFLGTPFMFDDPVTKPEVGGSKAEPLATESTLKGIRDGLSIMQSDLLSLNFKLKKGGSLHESLGIIADILENSAIARHSDSTLGKILNNIKESTVTFNEKTLRWHDDQTNLMVKGSDPRVAEAMAPKKSAVAEAVDNLNGTVGDSHQLGKNEKIGLPFIASQLEGIAQILSLQLNKMLEVTGESAEDKMENEALQENRDRDLKKYRKTIKGRWASFLKGAKENWFVKNWKLVAIGLAILLAPLKWIKKLWGWAVAFWEMPFWGKILTLVTGYIAWQKL